MPVGTHSLSGLQRPLEARSILRKRLLAELEKSAAALNGTIEGRIGLLMSGGEVVPCGSAAVHLLLQPIDIEVIKKKATLDSGALSPRLAHLYIDYVVSSPETQQKSEYARTKTDEKGYFEFPNLPADRWYYITAQALTGHVMVSWQVGVYLRQAERLQVVLTNANAVLPIYTAPWVSSSEEPSDANTS